MHKRKEGITIYPDAKVLKEMKLEAKKQQRSISNLMLYVWECWKNGE